MVRTISEHSQAQTAYEPTLWAKAFHSVPHVNITFHSVNSQFKPENDLYLESLGILASIPAAWLITTLVVLLIYLCTRCCDTKNTKKRKSRPIRCCLSFCALVTCATLAGGFYGNHILHGGVVEFEKATENINSIIKRAQEMTRKYNEVLQKNIEQNLNKLYDGAFQRDIREDPQGHFEIMDNSDYVFYNISEGLKAMDELRFAIDDPGARIDFRHIPFLAKQIEKYRWPTTMALQALFTLFCFLLFVGAIVHSRCVLILFSVFGLFSIIFLWLLASVYTTSAVAMADFCYEPTPWVVHILESTVSKDISSYYLKCGTGSQNPFERPLQASQRAITDIDRRVRKISGTARKYYTTTELSPFLDDLDQSTEETLQLMDNLSLSLRCEPIFRSYNTALVSICDSGLFGLIVMLLSSALSGLLFTILVWCNSHTWIYFKHKGRYIKVDDQDPYMPLSTIERPRMGHLGGGPPTGPTNSLYHRRTVHTPPQTPPYHGTLNGHQTQSPYGHVGGPPLGGVGATPATVVTANAATLGASYRNHHHYHMNTGPGKQGIGPSGGHAVGTLGRNTHHQASYQGMDNLPATMTLGRKGLYASLGAHRGRGGHGVGDNEAPLLGPNMGQYATLSKQCKTLESSDFY